MNTIIIEGFVEVRNKETNEVIFATERVDFNYTDYNSDGEEFSKLLSYNNVIRIIKALYTIRLLEQNKLQKLYNKEIVIDIKSYEARVSF